LYEILTEYPVVDHAKALENDIPESPEDKNQDQEDDGLLLDPVPISDRPQRSATTVSC